MASGGCVRLSHPSRSGMAAKLTFEARGQTLSNLVIIDDSYLKGSDVSVKAGIMGKVGTSLGTAAGSGVIVMQHILFTWQPVAFIKGRAVTDVDRWTEGVHLVVFDAQQWLPPG